MPGYRFCRTDDMALLANALNRCFVVHFPERLPLSLDDFKREIRELDVWCSSCMVAWADGDSIGVVIGAKRERETLIHSIGVHPEHQRQGHAAHLLESLSQKLATLGPPRIVAEVPDDMSAVCSLFESVGYQAETTLADFQLVEPPPAPPAGGEIVPAGLDDLLRCGALDATTDRSWQRALPTLQNRKEQLESLVIASDVRVEAYALFRDLPGPGGDPGRREIVALGGAEPANDHASDARILLEIAIRAACQTGSRAVSVPRIDAQEVPWTLLESLGFQRTRSYTRYAAVPNANTG